MPLSTPISRALPAAAMLVSLALAPALAHDPEPPPPTVEVTPDGEPVVVHEGEASFYGPGFHGKKTATGEIFDQNKPTAASRELPLGTKATVTNQENGKQVEVTINDRGPYAEGRVIDLSKGAARKLDMIEDGVAEVRVEAKPAEQPTEKAKDKVEEKAADIAQRTGVPLPGETNEDQVAGKEGGPRPAD
jgi:rare lipoprotein A